MRTAIGSAPKVFHGWLVVAAAFTITFVGFGSAYTFGSLLDPLQKEFHASRGSVSLIFSLAGFLYFALGALSGPMADRWGARRLAAGGMVLVGCGLMLAGQARTLAQVHLAYVLGIGLGVGCAYVPTLGAVQRWFVRRRGLASGLAVSGIGVGTLAMPPLATWLIEHLAWRHAYLALGCLAMVLGLMAASVLEDSPAARGLHPDGLPPEPSSSAGSPTGSSVGLSAREAIRTASFRGLYLACLIGSLGVFVPFVHLVPFAVDHGMAPTTAVWLLAAIGVGSTIGRFLLGDLADRIGRGTFLIGMHVGMAAALGIWALSETPGPLLIFALAFGLFYGGWVAMLPAIVADLFGTRHVGAIIGVLYTSVAIGTLIGPSSAGFAYDLSRSYLLPILLSAASSLIGAAVLAGVLKQTATQGKG